LSDPFTVRAALIDDAARIADLVRLAFSRQSRPTNPPPSALKETAATIAEQLARGGGAILEAGGALVGVVLWREARRRGLSRMTLGVRLALDDNRRLFRSCGFEETTLHRHEGFSEPTWVTMERRLRATGP